MQDLRRGARGHSIGRSDAEDIAGLHCEYLVPNPSAGRSPEDSGSACRCINQTKHCSRDELQRLVHDRVPEVVLDDERGFLRHTSQHASNMSGVLSRDFQHSFCPANATRKTNRGIEVQAQLRKGGQVRRDLEVVKMGLSTAVEYIQLLWCHKVADNCSGCTSALSDSIARRANAH